MSAAARSAGAALYVRRRATSPLDDKLLLRLMHSQVELYLISRGYLPREAEQRANLHVF